MNLMTEKDTKVAALIFEYYEKKKKIESERTVVLQSLWDVYEVEKRNLEQLHNDIWRRTALPFDMRISALTSEYTAKIDKVEGD